MIDDDGTLIDELDEDVRTETERERWTFSVDAEALRYYFDDWPGDVDDVDEDSLPGRIGR